MLGSCRDSEQKERGSRGVYVDLRWKRGGGEERGGGGEEGGGGEGGVWRERGREGGGREREGGGRERERERGGRWGWGERWRGDGELSEVTANKHWTRSQICATPPSLNLIWTANNNRMEIHLVSCAASSSENIQLGCHDNCHGNI